MVGRYQITILIIIHKMNSRILNRGTKKEKLLVWLYNVLKVNNSVIICLIGTKWQNCWKQDCDQSETKTEFKLEMNWDCSGKLTTITEVTDKNGRTNQIENASNCFDSQCQMPECPDHVQKVCRSTISKYS